MKFSYSIDSRSKRLGLTLPYEVLQADFRSLDGDGTYVRLQNSDFTLTVQSDGLTMHSAYAMSFIYDPTNLHQPQITPTPCPAWPAL